MKNPPFDRTTAKQTSKGGFSRHKDDISRQWKRIGWSS